MRHFVQNLLGVKPAAKSQHFVNTLGPQKPTWTNFLESEFFYLKRQSYMLTGKNMKLQGVKWLSYTQKNKRKDKRFSKNDKNNTCAMK